MHLNWVDKVGMSVLGVYYTLLFALWAFRK